MSSITKFKGQYSFLSNFYPCLVEFEGVLYPSVEHAFQAAKTLDTDKRKDFRVYPTPADAKYFGKKIDLRSDWESVKISIMRQLIYDKFERNVSDIDLKQHLIDTKDTYLEEGNNHGDRFWGTVKGEGRNELGKTLMYVRDQLKERR